MASSHYVGPDQSDHNASTAIVDIALELLAAFRAVLHLGFLVRRFRRAEALAIDTGSIEAANAPLPGTEHFAGVRDPTLTRL